MVSVQGGASDPAAAGGPILSGVLLEITEKREAATKLETAQSRLRRALDAGGMFWWEWKLPSGPAIGQVAPTGRKTGFGVLHPDDERAHRVALAAALRNDDGRYRCELRVENANGGYDWLLVSGQRSSDPGSPEAELNGVAMNITDRKATEEEIAESREWQRVAASAAELNLWRIDLDSGRRFGGDFDLRFYGGSPASLDDMLSKVEPEDRVFVEEALEHSRSQGQPYAAEYRVRSPLGEPRWVRDHGEILPGASGKGRQLVGVSIDISQQRQVTGELNNALRLAQEASEAKSSFLAAMSHELRTPLNAVIGFAGLLDRSTEPSVRDSHVYALQEGANQLMSVINDVLDFSRIEANALTLESEPFSISDCVSGAINLVAAAAENKGLCLMMVAHDAEGDVFVGDATRVRQIALNLLSNAIKFTDRGAVQLSLGIFRSGPLAEIVVGVADSGIGMAKDTVDRLFVPFRQGDASTVRRYGGSGLGLSICKRLVEMMGGSIEVDSAPGRGSRFMVRFALPELVDGRRERRRPLPGDRIGICVRSDYLRRALRDQLREYGARPIEIPAEDVDAAAIRRAGPLSALVVGQPLLPRLQQDADWPMDASGASPLPLVALVGFEVPKTEWIGAHAERIIPISRALTPRQLLGSLQSLAGRGGGGGPAGVPQPQDHDLFKGLRILLVEDNEINRTILMLQLESLGVVAYMAESGEEAIEVLSKLPCQIILMDVEMPGMDGMQTTALILDSVPEGQPPPYIVAVTAHVFGDTRERMKKSGMADFISKPVIIDELRAALLRGKDAVMAMA